MAVRKSIVFSTSTETVRIPLDAVIYITADGNYSAITMADGKGFTLTLQLGQIEQILEHKLEPQDNRFIRIGRSLIVNRDFIAFINPQHQKMILSDCKNFTFELSASKDALRALKELIDMEESI